MDINRANRQVADVLIQEKKTKALFLDFKTANTTTTNISADSVYARAKGANRIAFPNSPEGTLTIEAQVYPFKMFALFSDGKIDTTAVYGETQTVTATANGSLAVAAPTNGTIQAGTVFAYPADSAGDEDAVIAGTFATGTFTATTPGEIVNGQEYVVSYIVNRTGVKKISFNSKRTPKDYFITMSTVDKDEDGVLTPFKQTFYKATPQRNFELALSSDGEPVQISCVYDLLEDADGNFVDMIEITETEGMSVSRNAVAVAIGGTTSNIAIRNAVGTVTAAVKDSSNNAYAKLHALVSGDNDTVIIYADNDAVAGTYTVTLTDSTSGTAQTATITVTIPSA